jgi:hypothetical protein
MKTRGKRHRQVGVYRTKAGALPRYILGMKAHGGVRKQAFLRAGSVETTSCG